MKNLIKKYEQKLLFIEQDVMDGKYETTIRIARASAEQTIILDILRDLKKLQQAAVSGRFVWCIFNHPMGNDQMRTLIRIHKDWNEAYNYMKQLAKQDRFYYYWMEKQTCR